MKEFSCLTWNTAKRIKYSEEQTNFINYFKPDVVALQEVLINSDKKLKELLSTNYKNIISSFDLAPDLKILTKKRMFGQIIASNFKLEPNDPKDFNVPWQERVLSVKLFIDNSEIYFHTTHIPPGSGNGWIKTETLEGIYERLKEKKDNLNILCGDFNTPKEEDLKNGMMSFAQKINDKGEAIVRKSFRGGEGVRWDKGERDIIVGLNEIGIEDSFRKLFSYDVKEYSWKFNRKDNVIKRRFDHFFASKKFKVMDAKYLHNEKKLSDHSPLIVKYRIE